MLNPVTDAISARLYQGRAEIFNKVFMLTARAFGVATAVSPGLEGGYLVLMARALSTASRRRERPAGRLSATPS